jgi:hypothetical protein
MSYSAADFINDIENMAGDYDVPEVEADELEDCDPEIDEGDALRVLAERVGRGFSQRADSIWAAQLALALIKDTWVADHGNEQVGIAWGALHNALVDAGVSDG